MTKRPTTVLSLIRRSSLGQPDVMALRARTATSTAREIVMRAEARAQERRAGRTYTSPETPTGPLCPTQENPMSKKLTPGTPTPRSGQYQERGPRGGAGREITAVRGEPLPPTTKPGSSYTLVDPTKNSSGKP